MSYLTYSPENEREPVLTREPTDQPGREHVTMTQTKRELLDMLTFARPARTATEEAFVARFILPEADYQDAYGNLIRLIKPVPGNPLILWSCHTDTVHATHGRQAVIIDNDDWINLATSDSSCLGADDTAGVWLMLQMIRRNVPGLYVFHREEEIGGRGSSFIASNTPDLLRGVDCAIALDRKGTESIITHQGSRTCSDAFAKSLADCLNYHKSVGKDWACDDTGLFTDTANYTDHIGECTNLSVGYEKAHSVNEYLDFRFLDDLLESICKLDQAALVFQRQPGEIDPDYISFRDYKYTNYAWGFGFNGDMEYTDDTRRSSSERASVSLGRSTSKSKIDQIVDLVRDHPDAVADLLDGMGIGPDDILDYVYMSPGSSFPK